MIHPLSATFLSDYVTQQILQQLKTSVMLSTPQVTAQVALVS